MPRFAVMNSALLSSSSALIPVAFLVALLSVGSFTRPQAQQVANSSGDIEELSSKNSPSAIHGATRLANPPVIKPKTEANKPEPPRPDEDKPFDEVVKGMEVIKGLFTFYRKAEDNRVLMEILPEQMDRNFLFSISIDQSVGERGLYSSQMGSTFPFFFHPVGKNLQWVIKNTTFWATTNTPASRATARSFPNSILGVARVKSKPHPQRKSHLVEVSDLFLGDLPGLANALSDAYRPTAYRFDRGTTYLGAVKSFPENSLLEVNLHYVTDSPKVVSLTIPDERSVPIVVKYDFSSLPETGYRSRVADDRVGHFVTVTEDFSSDRPTSPYVRWINRWQLEKADPSAALSPPKQPIVFWLENTIPVEYRDWFTEGALLWNKAFERIGFKDAVQVRQQPDNADWDPADTRYNTIRWFAGADLSMAFGPSRANPFTGQIYDADVCFSEGIIRSVRRAGEDFVGPIVSPSQPALRPHPAMLASSQIAACGYAAELAQQAAFGVNVLEARGILSPELQEKLMHQFVVETVAHEVGHTLGLRHNFRASAVLPVTELNNVQKTSETGQSGSVMDYNPIVIAAKGETQGDFVPTTLGPYDYWAIEYAYKPIEGDESPELARIASRAADPVLGYSTDEDALGTYSPQAIDPLVNQFDQSSDPLAFFAQRVAIVHEFWQTMESKLGKQGEGYQVLRRAVGRGWGEYQRAVLIVAKYVGGVYHHRDHQGDPGGRVPYLPVSSEKQKQALAFLRDEVFTDAALQLPPGMQNKLAAERMPTIAGIEDNWGRLDYPWHETVLGLQRQVLDRLFNAFTLARIQDNELRYGPGEPIFRLADLFSIVEDGIWSEIADGAAEISSFRRNLQREHLKHLVRMTLRTYAVIEDATTLSRASLARIQEKIRSDLAAGKVKDPTSLAHLQETDARISAALQANINKPWE